MSRLAAMKEFAFMKALKDNGFPVPGPVAQNRHTIVMSLIDAFPLRQISVVPNPAALYAELLDMILRLAKFGLIHGDFNEFNILIKEESDLNAKGKASQNAEGSEGIRLVPILIDFPQMVSMDHTNAEMYFDRDVNCVKNFFRRRFRFTSEEPGPFFSDAKNGLLENPAKRLDVEVEASGFSRKMARELEAYMKEIGVDGDNHTTEDGEDGVESGNDNDEESNEEDDEETESGGDRVDELQLPGYDMEKEAQSLDGLHLSSSLSSDQMS